MKKLLLSVLILCGFAAQGQHYYNEWIDYTKTYYKFKLATTGLYRIPQATLAGAGLGMESAENFQLWRNGQQVPLYTSVASGTLSTSDYLEFWGEMNDGKPDKELYKKAEYQLNEKWSLETDSATYFLTVNPSGANLRLANTTNNTAGNTLPAEPYFMYTAGTYYKNQINPGFAINVGEYLYSSSYDNGEGWTSANIDSVTILTTKLTNLYVYPSGPDAVLNLNAFGKAIQQRRVGVRVNNAVIDTTQHMDFFDALKKSYPIPISLISSNAATISIDNIATIKTDRMVVAQHELIYPRLFNFGGAVNFQFTLPEKSTESYLEISNFAFGTAAPVLYDLTNNKRYVGDISAAPLVKFVIAPSETERRLVLVKNDASNTTAVTSLQERKFIDYTSPAYTSNYMIITNRQLMNSSDGSNPIEEYRAYRSSATGGGYDAKIYFEDELADQFGYGIKKNPIAIRNFILYARKHFSPAHVFLLGKGVNYTAQYTNRNNPDIDRLNLVPTFGWPASDALLTADPGSSIPQLSFGRLSAINAREVAIYLKKVKEFEKAQLTLSPNRVDREWMKNVVHLNGINDPGLKEIIDESFEKYKNIIADTLFGARVTKFEKNSTTSVEQISSSSLDALFKEGITLMTYFGHSASSALSYNLDKPEAYENQGKYPLFIALGCNVGDFFNFNTRRFSIDETVSESFVLAEDHGSIGFIASTYYGLVHYLDVWNTQAYKALAATDYGAPIGEIMVKAAKGVFDVENIENFYAYSNVEQSELHADPALRLNPHAKPDYIVDEQLVKTSPDFISVAEPFFKVRCRFVNTGMALNRTVVAEVKRQYPNGTTEVVYRDTLSHLYYTDSISINLPVDALRDKGINKITVTIDADNTVDELFETNNSVTKEVVIYVDELKPVYPNNFAIVNKPSFKFITSTANVFSGSKTYRFELDTTALFNSPLKINKSVMTGGGLVEFDAGTDFKANTVYFWRVATVPDNGPITWNTASFIYMPEHPIGFNQSHLHQKLKSDYRGMYLDSTSQQLQFSDRINNLFIRNGVWVSATGLESDIIVNVNGDSYIRNTCIFGIIFNVFDKQTFKPWKNENVNGAGLYGTYAPDCAPTRMWNFEFSNDTSGRRKAYDFLKIVPEGDFVVARITMRNVATNQYVQDWKADEAIYGAGKTLYDLLKNMGFSDLDSFNRVRSFAAVLKVGDPAFAKQKFSEGAFDVLTLSVDCQTPGFSGTITSPQFGPAKEWKQLMWQGHSVETTSTDHPSIDVIGVRINGKNDTLYRAIDQGQHTFDLSGINALQYPYLQLHMNNIDSINFTPYQLDYWRLTHVPVPEGALAPKMYLNMKDTLEAGEPFDMQIAFKNISETPFDSLKIKLVVTDANNVQHVLPVQRMRPLAANDTVHVHYNIDTKQLGGMNSLYIEVNPDNDQLEQYHFNNYAFKNFYVLVDSLNPLLDVTFDNMHILNNDIVSSKPDILIKLKDDAGWRLLDDTALVKVQVKFPGEINARNYAFNSDTLQFTPAANASDNTASINFNPYFTDDGIYELIVSGKDRSGNKAGETQYRVAFEVINKPMISNMLNYPNPFTTSTAFVFTLTGSEIPSEFKIQVLTVTGKVVKEITRAELGPLHIGRNITEYKWDGTDQYGQKLANGVYLYRVVTSLNGKKLDKYKSERDDTDKYFNKGYGKMYLMR